MKPVFLDTGYLIALEAGDDRTMQQPGLERALAFDRHFIQAGFQKLP